jgi:hypothetical protein
MWRLAKGAVAATRHGRAALASQAAWVGEGERHDEAGANGWRGQVGCCSNLVFYSGDSYVIFLVIPAWFVVPKRCCNLWILCEWFGWDKLMFWLVVQMIHMQECESCYANDWKNKWKENELKRRKNTEGQTTTESWQGDSHRPRAAAASSGSSNLCSTPVLFLSDSAFRLVLFSRNKPASITFLLKQISTSNQTNKPNGVCNYRYYIRKILSTHLYTNWLKTSFVHWTAYMHGAI